MTKDVKCVTRSVRPSASRLGRQAAAVQGPELVTGRGPALAEKSMWALCWLRCEVTGF